MAARFIHRNKHTIIYGIGLALLLILLKWLEWRFIIFDHAIEVYSGAIAILFTGLGIWLALRLAKPKTIVVEKEIVVTREPAPHEAAPGEPVLRDPSPREATLRDPAPPLNEKEQARLGISARELEVLQLMAGGLSNQEIAARLFVSLNTIKTHSSKIFEKLDVQRRTQAVDKARRLNIIV
jgi:DNA-binding CsgD family transcriptional regulator